jgi:hypothetical protein
MIRKLSIIPVSKLRQNVVFSFVPPFMEPPTNAIFQSIKAAHCSGHDLLIRAGASEMVADV